MNLLVIAGLLAATFTRPLERVSSMDPSNAQSIYDSHTMQLVYEPPLAIDYLARPYRYVPGYCELPETSDDGLTYLFTVREGRSAADMVRSLERLRDPTLPNGWIVKNIASIRALDDRRVEIRLARRADYFPWLMTHTACAVVGADGEGTGPYRLVRWRKNHEMVFERRKKVEDGFNTVRYLVIDDLSTQWLMFLKGEIDFLGEMSRDNWDAIVGADGKLSPELTAKGVRLYGIPSLEVFYVGVNMRDSVLGANKKLRQALNCAFDYPAWERFYSYRTAACTGPLPPGVPERLETPFAYSFDLEKAKKLMAEAGYTDGIDPKTGRRLILTVALGRADQSGRESGELLASFYEKIGVRLELDFMTWDAFLKAVNECRTQLYFMAWVGDYPNAQNFLQLFYGPNRAPGVNHSCYENAAYDAAYERGDYRTCQEIVREDCPWIFTHYKMEYSLVNERVHNYVPSDFPYGAEQYFKTK